MAFPTTLDSFTNRTNAPGLGDTSDTSYIIATGSLQGYGYYNDILTTLAALEAKLGINSSAVTTSIDYLLRNSGSLNPGHRHNALYDSTGTNSLVSGDANNNLVMGNHRFQLAKGTINIASANNLTLDGTGNYFAVSGTTQINLLDVTNWQLGSVVTMVFFSGSLVVKHNQAASGSFKPMMLNNGVDFTTSASAPGSTLTLVQDNNAQWVEIARKV